MKLRYIYSACVLIETDRVKLLCDPWFTQGIYYGSWFQYPPLPVNPEENIGKVDAIYISHVHEDHFDKVFLKNYLSYFPDTRLLIAKHKPSILKNVMRREGFFPEEIDETIIGDLDIAIFPNKAHGDLIDIDSGACFRCGNQIILNLNDCSFDKNQVIQMVNWCDGLRPTLGMFSYTGASAFPQMYYSQDAKKRSELNKHLIKLEMDLFEKYRESFNPEFTLPFAGKYWLGGPLIDRNDKRAVSDAVETKLLPNSENIIILEDWDEKGGSYFDCEKKVVVGSERRDAYDNNKVFSFLKSLKWSGFDYEREINIPTAKLPLFNLLKAAYKVAKIKANSPFKTDCWIVFAIKDQPTYIAINPWRDIEPKYIGYDELEKLDGREEILIDPRLLFGLLTNIYNWDNAYIGSHYEVKRVPDIYRPDLIRWLNWLHI
tara:strand:+ start:20388 stop:21680 length:1293 start_codon:yes stop_codon:yes gene_type:complete